MTTDREANTSSSVAVSGYVQSRNGHDVAISAHTRAAPPHHTQVAEAGIAGQTDTIPEHQPKPKDAFVADNIETFKAEALAKTSLYGNGHCVVLVKAAVPALARTWAPIDWRAGAPLRGIDDPPLEPGTAIATFEKDGTYGDKKSGQHAAIFLK